MKTYVGVEVRLHAFLVSVVGGCEWSVSRPGRFIPGERVPSTHWLGGWDGSRAGLDAVTKKKISPSAGNRNLVIQLVA